MAFEVPVSKKQNDEMKFDGPFTFVTASVSSNLFYKKFLPLGFPNSTSPDTDLPGPLVSLHLDCLHGKIGFPTDMDGSYTLSANWNLHALWGKALTLCQDIWAVVHLYYVVAQMLLESFSLNN